MIAVQARTRIWNSRFWESVWESPARVGWWTALGMMLPMAILMMTRRLVNHFQQPLPPGYFITMSLLVVLTCLSLRHSRRIAGLETLSRQAAMAVLGLITIAQVLLMLAISLPNTSVLGLVVGWSIVVAAEASWWTLYVGQQDRRVAAAAISPGSTAPTDPFGPTAASVIQPTSSDDALDEPWPADVTQQLTRMRGEAGVESLFGGVRVNFAPGERQRCVHLSFCPPLDQSPQFHVEQSEGPLAKIEVTQLEPFGVRLEVKLQQDDDRPASVVLQFEAVSRL